MAKLDVRNSLSLAILATVGASVCCVAPLVLLMLGIGGAWIGNLTAMEPYRPVFIGVAFVFIWMAFRKLYLVPADCAPGTSCANPAVLKRQRLIFWIVTVFMLGLLAVPTLAPFFI